MFFLFSFIQFTGNGCEEKETWQVKWIHYYNMYQLFVTQKVSKRKTEVRRPGQHKSFLIAEFGLRSIPSLGFHYIIGTWIFMRQKQLGLSRCSLVVGNSEMNGLTRGSDNAIRQSTKGNWFTSIPFSHIKLLKLS
jgi:hypothetical protein